MHTIEIGIASWRDRPQRDMYPDTADVDEARASWIGAATYSSTLADEPVAAVRHMAPVARDEGDYTYERPADAVGSNVLSSPAIWHDERRSFVLP